MNFNFRLCRTGLLPFAIANIGHGQLVDGCLVVNGKNIYDFTKDTFICLKPPGNDYS